MANQCVILVGGTGARPDERTKTTATPPMQVGGAPFLEILLGEARRRGFDDFLLLTGPCQEAVIAFLAQRDVEGRFACRVSLSREPALLGSGGALVHALPRLRDDFLLLDGRAWFDFNWLDLVVSARKDGAVAAVGLREIASADRRHTVELDGGRVIAVYSRRTNFARGLADGGVYYLTRQAVEDWKAPTSPERGILPLIARGALRGYRYSGFFIDIDVPENLSASLEGVANRRRRPAVFLDRDGVLNLDHGYVHAPHQVEWVRGAKEGVKLVNDAGYYLFVVTNQAGVAKGLYCEEAIGTLHRWMAEELSAVGASIDDWRYCPYHPEGIVAQYRLLHDWRKPGPGMLTDLFAHWPIERRGSFLVGDKVTDVEAAGIPGHLFEGGDLALFLQERLKIGQQQAPAGAR